MTGQAAEEVWARHPTAGWEAQGEGWGTAKPRRIHDDSEGLEAPPPGQRPSAGPAAPTPGASWPAPGPRLPGASPLHLDTNQATTDSASLRQQDLCSNLMLAFTNYALGVAVRSMLAVIGGLAFAHVGVAAGVATGWVRVENIYVGIGIGVLGRFVLWPRQRPASDGAPQPP